MLLITNNRVKSRNKTKLAILKDGTRASKDLYNKALYTIRQHFFERQEYLPYPKVYHLLKASDEYKRVLSNASQQTMKQVENAFKSFFTLLRIFPEGKLPL